MRKFCMTYKHLKPTIISAKASYTDGHFFEFFKTKEELKTDEHPHLHPMIVLVFDSSKKAAV